MIMRSNPYGGGVYGLKILIALRERLGILQTAQPATLEGKLLLTVGSGRRSVAYEAYSIVCVLVFRLRTISSTARPSHNSRTPEGLPRDRAVFHLGCRRIDQHTAGN